MKSGATEHQARLALDRLLPRVRARLEPSSALGRELWEEFRGRLAVGFPGLFSRLITLYAGEPDLYFHLEEVLVEMAGAALARPAELRALDARRLAEPGWFLSETQLGGVCYVDRYAGDLVGMRERLDELEDLGLTYLHLMPLSRCPEGENDGGYAVSDFRQVDPRLGTTAELRDLAAELRRRGISLCLDLVFNHTSDQHAWARGARAGDPELQAVYRMFPDRSMPDRYEQHLREIFPDERPGSFTWCEEVGRWVWTTFHSYQWDLNYANPDVFRRMLGELLFLANLGVEVLRLDAVAFVWKRLGTSCENLPEAHTLIQAFAAAARVVAPAMAFKSEAIVHPDEVVRYIDADECPISYNPLLMALTWNSLATRKTRLLRRSLAERHALPPGCSWVNYLRCHDDIGWTFDDGEAGELGIQAGDHRDFLNAFYLGRFEGSFSRGVPFQEDPKTGDCRVSGTTASLAGLEAAMEAEDPAELELALARIQMMHSVIFTAGGIPLLYLGDELGQRNDHGYLDDPHRARDSRWVHRPARDPEAARQAREEPASVPARIRAGLRAMARERAAQPALAADRPMRVLPLENPHVFAFTRGPGDGELLLVHSFHEEPQRIEPGDLRAAGWEGRATDLLSGATLDLDAALDLEPYQVLWLRKGDA